MQESGNHSILVHSAVRKCRRGRRLDLHYCKQDYRRDLESQRRDEGAAAAGLSEYLASWTVGQCW